MNLIEAIVNKKLEELNEKAEGSFEKRFERLAQAIKKREKRDISKLLPLAIYKGVRNKLDHASHSASVTPQEAKDICKIVTNLLNEILK